MDNCAKNHYFEASESVVDRIRALLMDEDLEVKLCTSRKNNGILLTGIQIRHKDLNVAPVFYLPDCCETPEQEEEAARFIVNQYRDIRVRVGDTRLEFEDYEQMREKLRIGIMNLDLNYERLQGVPFREFLDLAEVVYVEVLCAGDKGTILVNQELLRRWGIDEDELFAEAKLRSRTQDPVMIETLDSVIEDISGCCMGQTTPFLMVSSRKDRRGASVLFYPDTAEKILEKTEGESFYVIPSSISELLVLPESSVESTDYIKGIIREVNEEVLKPDEILSDNLYYYDKSTQQYEIVI